MTVAAQASLNPSPLPLHRLAITRWHGLPALARGIDLASAKEGAVPPRPGAGRVLSLIPPMTQLNTPYPSTAYLTGFLRSRGTRCRKTWRWRWCSAVHAGRRAARLAQPEAQRTASVHSFLDQFEAYRATIGPVIAYLQGRDSTLAYRIAARGLLPEGPRFSALDNYVMTDSGDPLGWAFGALGVQDKARHLCTLYLNDLSDVIRDAADERFEFVRYAESLASSQPSFDPLANALAAPAHPGGPAAARPDPGGPAPPPAHAGAAVRALPRRHVRGAAHRADHQGAEPAHPHRPGRRLRQHRAARAERPARVRLRRLRDAGRGRAARAVADRAPARRARQAAAAAHLPARERRREVCEPGRARHPVRGRGHAHLGRPAHRPLPQPAGHAQPHAPALERRALEQADRGARLLLEEVQLLRREPGLHRPLRNRDRVHPGRPHREDRGTRPARPASTSSTKRRRPRRSRPWPRS